jgi:hypothetical protein
MIGPSPGKALATFIIHHFAFPIFRHAPPESSMLAKLKTAPGTPFRLTPARLALSFPSLWQN